jgi:hypothetical protein
VFAAQASVVPIAVAMLLALGAFAAGLPVLIHDSRLPPRPRPAKPIVIREPRPVKPSRQIVLPVAFLRATPAPPVPVSTPPPPAPAPSRRLVVTVTALVVLSIWSTTLVRTRPAARR